jgi:membrane associated rhomboid family serine protease
MAELSTDLLEIVLKDVATAGAGPWYAADYAQATGVPRDRLDACLDRLRLSGLVRLTDWVQGRGQGYQLTPEGEHVLSNPRLLDRLREGRELPRRAEARSQAAPPTLREAGTTWDRGEAIRAALLNPPQPVITKTLLALNVLAFVVGIALASRQGLAGEYLNFASQDQKLAVLREDLGTLKFRDIAINHEWWRLLSHCFVHLGLIHLLMNMYVLYAIGSVVEAMWGHSRYLALYLISGLTGGAAQLIIDPRVSMGGASGALCGLLTSMGVWVWLNRPFLPPRLVSEWMRNIMTNVMLIAFISIVPGVSWAGHLGGGVGGVVVAVPLVYSRFGSGAQRWLGWAGVAAVPLVAVLLVQRSLPSGPAGILRELDRLRPNDAGVQQARAKYRPIYLKADSLSDRVFENDAARILKGRFDPKEAPETARQYALKFAKTAKQLRELADGLGGAEQFDSPVITAHVTKAREFVEAWVQFYSTFAESLSPVENWGEQRRQDLLAEFNWTQQLRRALRNSPIFRADAADPDA